MSSVKTSKTHKKQQNIRTVLFYLGISWDRGVATVLVLHRGSSVKEIFCAECVFTPSCNTGTNVGTTGIKATPPTML